jgi:hypothetical protein
LKEKEEDAKMKVELKFKEKYKCQGAKIKPRRDRGL